MATEITDKNFSELIEKSGKVSLVDFWAPWCGPCRALTPIIDELSSDFSEKNVVIGKVNVDENSDISSRFKIRSIPTLLFIDSKGNVVDTLVGTSTKTEISNKINELLKKDDE